jgi:ubiquinone/menaquinone biosynthesis C-methylase UbiE
VSKRPVATRYQHVEVAAKYDVRFQGLAGRYNNWRILRLLTRILRHLPARGVALDVACGTGRIEESLGQHGFRVVATDISSEMLAVARRKVGDGPSFLRTDAHDLPFRSASVDAVFSIRFLHLLNEPMRQAALKEMARVSKRWVVVEYRSMTKPLRAAKRAVLRWITKRPGKRSPTINDVRAELAACGLVAERHYFASRWFSGSVLVVARRRDVT